MELAVLPSYVNVQGVASGDNNHLYAVDDPDMAFGTATIIEGVANGDDYVLELSW